MLLINVSQYQGLHLSKDDRKECVKALYSAFHIIFHQSATALKPATDDVNGIGQNYSTMFQWKALRPGIHVDVLTHKTPTWIQMKKKKKKPLTL